MANRQTEIFFQIAEIQRRVMKLFAFLFVALAESLTAPLASIEFWQVTASSPRCPAVAMGVSRKKRREQTQTVVKQAEPREDAEAEETVSRALQEPGSADADVLLASSSGEAPSAPAIALSGCEPVFALESRDLLDSARIGTLAAAPTYDAILAALLNVQQGDVPMAAFVQANRDLLDYRFLYRMTADKLRAENTGQDAQAHVLQEARTRAVQATQRFDAPLFKQVR